MSGILVVEDERVVARDIEETLVRLGYQVMGRAATGEDCLRHANASRPDLVLMDVRLEGELDGIEVARRLKSSFDVPIIFLTAYADDETLARARETEAHGYLLKPFRASELRSAVEIALFKHKMEVELRRRERWFSTTLRAIGEGVIAVDAEANIRFANPAAADLVGKGEQELAGLKLANVFRIVNSRTREPILDLEQVALRERTVVRLPPGTLLVRSDDELPIEDSISAIVDTGGELLGAVVVFRDVREQHLLREQVATADRLASLGTLAAGVAHEINNPLTYIMGNAELAGYELEGIEKALSKLPQSARESTGVALLGISQTQRLLREMHEGAERISKIVGDLRLFARPDAVPGRGDAVAALEWALRVTDTLIKSRARLELAVQPTPLVRGDVTRLGQVFVNLLVNAAQSIPENVPELNRIFVAVSTADEHVTVEIRDTGCGMAPDVMRQIFDPFFTTKTVGSGTGLGLSVCRGIVEGLGGEIAVDSAVGEGSAFRVILPVAARHRGSSGSPPSSSQLLRGRILVVDDDQMVATTMARMLGRQHDALIAPSGRRALALLQEDSAFDMVLCDLLMPDMTGMELHARLLEHDPELARRVVFITGAFTPQASDFLARVTNPRLPKPVTMTDLDKFVQTFLANSRRPPPGTPAPSS